MPVFPPREIPHKSLKITTSESESTFNKPNN